MICSSGCIDSSLVVSIINQEQIGQEFFKCVCTLQSNRKDSPGKEVEVVWACDEKRGALRGKEGDGNESTGEKGERSTT